MPFTNFPQQAKKFEIKPFDGPKDKNELKKNHVPFTGSPQKHPYDDDKIILITDPYSSNFSYYEFKNKNVTYVEELPTISNIEGDTINMARIWVKKKSVGIHSTPFYVENTVFTDK